MDDEDIILTLDEVAEECAKDELDITVDVHTPKKVLVAMQEGYSNIAENLVYMLRDQGVSAGYTNDIDEARRYMQKGSVDVLIAGNGYESLVRDAKENAFVVASGTEAKADVRVREEDLEGYVVDFVSGNVESGLLWEHYRENPRVQEQKLQFNVFADYVASLLDTKAA